MEWGLFATDPHHMYLHACPGSKYRQINPASRRQGSFPAPCAHPHLHSISWGRETLLYTGWEAKAGCQVYFSFNKCSLGSAACGKTKGTVRGFSWNCLVTVFGGRKRQRQQQQKKKKKWNAGEEKQQANRAGDPTCQTPAEQSACPSVWLVSPTITCIPVLPPPSAALHPAALLATFAKLAQSGGIFRRQAPSALCVSWSGGGIASCQGSLFSLFPNKVLGLAEEISAKANDNDCPSQERLMFFSTLPRSLRLWAGIAGRCVPGCPHGRSGLLPAGD